MSARKARRAHTHSADRKSPPDVDAILNRLADAISVIATAASAIECAEDIPAPDDPAKATDKARCLVLGLQELARVRIDIAVALGAA